jgi:hypothetical protein
MSGSSSAGKTGYCPQCGAPLRASASFCTACGAATTGSAPAAAVRTQSSARRGFSLWLVVAAVLAIVAVAAIGLSLLNDSQPSTSTPVAIPTVAVSAQDIPYPDVARVSPEQAHMSAMSGEAVLVDVRGQEFYNMGHARGAISLPLDQLPARFSDLPKDKALLFYCT